MCVCGRKDETNRVEAVAARGACPNPYGGNTVLTLCPSRSLRQSRCRIDRNDPNGPSRHGLPHTCKCPSFFFVFECPDPSRSCVDNRQRPGQSIHKPQTAGSARPSQSSSHAGVRYLDILLPRPPQFVDAAIALAIAMHRTSRRPARVWVDSRWPPWESKPASIESAAITRELGTGRMDGFGLSAS